MHTQSAKYEVVNCLYITELAESIIIKISNSQYINMLSHNIYIPLL